MLKTAALTLAFIALHTPAGLACGGPYRGQPAPKAEAGNDAASIDPFLQRHQADVEKDGSRSFTIAFATEQRVFHPGEAIPLVFTFRRFTITPHNYQDSAGLGGAELVLDHLDRTDDPRADFRLDPSQGGAGGKIGCVAAATETTPLSFNVYLNQAVRFDGAGHFRFYAISHHREDSSGLPLTSNILEIDITDRDREWEQQAFAAAAAKLESHPSDDRADAWQTIEFLGTRDSALAIANALKTEASATAALWGGGELMRAAYAVRDRPYMIALLKKDLDDGDLELNPRRVQHLSWLELTSGAATRAENWDLFEARVRSYSVRHFRAMARAGRLRAHLTERLQAAGQRWSLRVIDLTAAYEEFSSEVSAVMLRLPPPQQKLVLAMGKGWTVFQSPQFLPLLRALARADHKNGPQNVALRLLTTLAPAEARAIIFAELSQRTSRFGIDTLGLIPEGELPQLDERMIVWLESASTLTERARALERIGRFGSPAIGPRLRKEYERLVNQMDDGEIAAALAFFARSDPPFARAEFNRLRTVDRNDAVTAWRTAEQLIEFADVFAPGQLGAVTGWPSDARPKALKIYIAGPFLPAQEPSASVDMDVAGYDESLGFESSQALLRWMRMYPKGTTFTWALRQDPFNLEWRSDDSLPADIAAYVERVRSQADREEYTFERTAY